jgi:hypothetical protein
LSTRDRDGFLALAQVSGRPDQPLEKQSLNLVFEQSDV